MDKRHSNILNYCGLNYVWETQVLSGIFHYRKDKQLYGYLFSIKEVLSFPLTTPVTNNSKDKCPNDKNQLGIYFEPALNGRGSAYGIG